jgi:two-component system NarL family sensor kinase
MAIKDNGVGMPQDIGRRDRPGGLGLRNMQERIEQLDGNLKIMSSRDGTLIEAELPLSHLLPPEEPNDPAASAASHLFDTPKTGASS